MHHAKITMQEIMEKYLLYIYTKFLEYDPLSSVDYTEEYTREINSESNTNGESNSNSKSDSLNIINNTPETNITKQQLESGVYASTVSQNDTNLNDKTTTKSDGKGKTVEKYTHSMKGDNGVIVTNQYLVREFRELAISIDLEIIKELNKLFMAIY